MAPSSVESNLEIVIGPGVRSSVNRRVHDPFRTNSREDLDLSVNTEDLVKAGTPNIPAPGGLCSSSSQGSTSNATLASINVPVDSQAFATKLPAPVSLISSSEGASGGAIQITHGQEIPLSPIILPELSDESSSVTTRSRDVDCFPLPKLSATEYDVRFAGAIREIQQASQREIADLRLQHENDMNKVRKQLLMEKADAVKTARDDAEAIALNAKREKQEYGEWIDGRMEQLLNQTAAAVADIEARHKLELEAARLSGFASRDVVLPTVGSNAALESLRQQLDLEHGEHLSRLSSHAEMELVELRQSVELLEVRLKDTEAESKVHAAKVRSCSLTRIFLSMLLGTSIATFTIRV